MNCVIQYKNARVASNILFSFQLKWKWINLSMRSRGLGIKKCPLKYYLWTYTSFQESVEVPMTPNGVMVLHSAKLSAVFFFSGFLFCFSFLFFVFFVIPEFCLLTPVFRIAITSWRNGGQSVQMPPAGVFGEAAFSAISVLKTLTHILSHSRVVERRT